jgi:hypothetical protein
MAIHLPPHVQPSSPSEIQPVPAAPGWRRGLLRLRLQLRAWWICVSDDESHPVAELIARGEWAALDRLVDDLDALDEDDRLGP